MDELTLLALVHLEEREQVNNISVATENRLKRST